MIPFLRPRRLADVAVLAVLVAMLGTVGVSVARTVTWFGQRHAAGVAISNHAVISVNGAAPGDLGSKRVVVANNSSGWEQLRLSQSLVSHNALSSALRMSIYDMTTKRCLWPLTTKHATRCNRYGAWDASRRITDHNLPGAKVLGVWAKHERHVLVVRWWLPSTSTNAVQDLHARFALTWRAR